MSLECQRESNREKGNEEKKQLFGLSTHLEKKESKFSGPNLLLEAALC